MKSVKTKTKANPYKILYGAVGNPLGKTSKNPETGSKPVTKKRAPTVLTLKSTIRDFLLASEGEILDYAASLPGAVSGGTYVWIPSEDPNPMMIVAHVDTVRTTQLLPKALVFNRGVFRTTDKQALGADDRAGVFAVLAIREHCLFEGLKVPHILLTDGEESGGIGVSDFIADKVLDPYESGITMLLEFDRKGADEAVTYGGDLPDKACEYIESWGWQTGHGSYTDISSLIDTYQIPGVNLSVGYYDQHTSSERLVINHLRSTINTAIKMLADPLTTKEKQIDRWGGYSRSGYGWEDWGIKEDKYDTRIDMVLDALYRCPDCANLWHSCTCGTIALELIDQLTEKELEILIDEDNGYFVAGDAPADEIAAYLRGEG